MYIHIHICSYIYTQTCMYINTLVDSQIHIHTSYAYIHTYFFSLWLSLSGNLDVPDRYRRQNTHASTMSLTMSLCVLERLVISLSFVHTHAYTHTLSLTHLHTYCVSFTHTHTHTLSPSLPDKLSASNRHRLQHKSANMDSVSLCVLLQQEMSLSSKLTHTHTLSLSLSLSHTQATWMRQTPQPS